MTDEKNDNGFLPPDIVESETNGRDEKIMSWVGHLAELRSRLLKIAAFFAVAFAAVYPFAQKMMDVLTVPLMIAMKARGGTNRLIFTSLTEGFVTHLALAGFCAAVLTFPYFAVQAWLYVKPALYESERKSVKSVLCLSPVLFVIGGAFAFFIVMPAACKFFLGFQSAADLSAALPVALEAKLSEYLSFVIHLTLAFGAGFQFPVVLFVAVKAGICSLDSLRKARRFVIVAVFVFAAVVTPPDILSQVALALPLLALYEITLLILKNNVKNA